jgi:hypothetical protein
MLLKKKLTPIASKIQNRKNLGAKNQKVNISNSKKEAIWIQVALLKFQNDSEGTYN